MGPASDFTYTPPGYEPQGSITIRPPGPPAWIKVLAAVAGFAFLMWGTTVTCRLGELGRQVDALTESIGPEFVAKFKK